jgi:hypothetical protein
MILLVNDKFISQNFIDVISDFFPEFKYFVTFAEITIETVQLYFLLRAPKIICAVLMSLSH